MNDTPAEQVGIAANDRLHRDVREPFYRAVPPRPTPWRRRVLWRVMMAFAATPLAGFMLRRR